MHEIEWRKVIRLPPYASRRQPIPSDALFQQRLFA